MGYVRGNEPLAKDLVQEVFVKVWENLSSFRNESSLSTWIYRVTVNTCLSQLRKDKYNLSFKDAEQVTSIDENETSHENENKLKQLYVCIDQLAKRKKGIILLELEGLPQKEIAEITGLTHEAVRTTIHRIKNKLKKCVKK